MSCFVMKPERIATLAAYIAYVLNRNEFTLYPEDGLYQFADCTLPDETTFFDEEKIYRKMYLFNVEAYRERYPDEPNENPDFVPEFRPDRAAVPPKIWHRGDSRKIGYWTITPEHYALFKSLECYLYQTAEGKCLDSDFRKELKFLRDDLQSFIVFNTPEFVLAEWG